MRTPLGKILVARQILQELESPQFLYGNTNHFFGKYKSFFEFILFLQKNSSFGDEMKTDLSS